MSAHFDPNKVEIIDFKITQGRIDAPFEFDASTILNFETTMSFHPSFDVENCLVRVDMGFEITTNSAIDQREAKAEFNFVYIFKIENLSHLVEMTKKKIGKVNENLTVAIAAIAFSTSRGILMTRLQGTAMENYILKIIAPEDLLTQS